MTKKVNWGTGNILTICSSVVVCCAILSWNITSNLHAMDIYHGGKSPTVLLSFNTDISVLIENYRYLYLHTFLKVSHIYSGPKINWFAVSQFLNVARRLSASSRDGNPTDLVSVRVPTPKAIVAQQSYICTCVRLCLCFSSLVF